MTSKLIGYVRMKGGQLVLNISEEAIKEAERSETHGHIFIKLQANADKINEIINQDREVTSIVQVIGD